MIAQIRTNASTKTRICSPLEVMAQVDRVACFSEFKTQPCYVFLLASNKPDFVGPRLRQKIDCHRESVSLVFLHGGRRYPILLLTNRLPVVAHELRHTSLEVIQQEHLLYVANCV